MRKKNTAENKTSKKSFYYHNFYFSSLVILVVGLSMYGIGMFVSSTNDHLNLMFASVPETDEVAYEESSEKKNPFLDLSSNHENVEAVVALYYAGIVKGYDDGTFKSDNKVTRAEFSKMLVEATDLDYSQLPPDQLANCFSDVSDLPEHWFAPSVCAAKYMGWVKGYEGGVFQALQNITRAEALKVILEAFDFYILENGEVDAVPYSDVSLKEHWYLGVAKSAKDYGIISGDGLFNAGLEVTRGDTAQMIYNAMRIKGFL